jgi:uncharacterized protein YcbX
VTVVGLWRYPVKSMGGESLDALEVGDLGVVGDRVLALVGQDTGRVLTAKRERKLLSASSRWIDGEVEITIPSGQTMLAGDQGTAGKLSEWLDRPVRLAAPGPEQSTVEPYAANPETDRFDSTFDLPAWSFVDDSPIHVLSEESLRQGRTWHPDGVWDIRRFRPNIVVDGSVTDSGVVTVGTAELEIIGPCGRCVMVTQPQSDLPVDRRILATLIQRVEADFGVYVSPRHTGTVRLGDLVRDQHTTSASGHRP